MTPAIELDGLGRRYGSAFVLKNIDLQITAGKTVLLRGGNGAGKTTLLRVLSTRLRPSRGAGKIFGADLARQAAEVRERVVYVSVLGGAYGALTALENLRLSASLYGKRVDESALSVYLDELGLGAASRKLVRTFSSGMRKRLALARLKLSDASLWLLDEPYAALDDDGKHLVDTLLGEARAAGKTVVMASHDLARSRHFADATLHIEQGRLQAAYSSDEAACV